MATQLFESGASDVLYLIDLSGYVFRAYHAIAPLTSPSGEPTHAVLGTVNMLERLVRQCKPQLLAVAMDSRTPTFRKELFPAYKANRPPPPDDLRVQMKRVAQLLQAFPLPCFQLDGFEADDLIATAVKQALALNLRVVIVSADKDLMQLVSPSVILWDTMRDKVFGVDEVVERFGVPVASVRDVLALMGDTSDNVPGVPSVGPKTATELLTQFGSLEQVYAGLEAVARKKLRETLEQYKDQAFVSQHLVTLKDDVALTFDLESVRFERTPTPELRALYAELGFQRHLATLDARGAAEARATSDAPARRGSKSAAAAASGTDGAVVAGGTPQRELFQSAPSAFTTTLITQYPECEALVLAIEPLQRVSLALALDGGFPMTGNWVGLALSLRPEHAVYLPLGHLYVGAPQQLSVAEAVRFLNQLLDKGVQIGAFDGESTQVVLQRHGVNLKTTSFDALISSYLLELDTAHELPRLVQGQLGDTLPSYPVPEKRSAKAMLTETREVSQVAEIVGAQAEALQRLWSPLSTRLEEEELRPVYDLDRPLSDLLAEMEQFGILLDVEQLRKLGREVGSQLLEQETAAHQLLGREFNVNSPRQLETILFDELGLKPLKRTKTARSTDAETLEALADDHALPKTILEIRQLAKLKGTYIDALPALVNSHTGRLHTHWHQEIAATGRLSSTDPNLQNIPIRTELGKRIRQAFIAKPGHQLISADYSQIELRVLAHLSKDQTLLDAFRNGQDIHLRTAMEIFEVPEAEVTSELRRRAKAVNFGVIYGQGDGALSKSLGISRSDAGQFIAAYFRRYAGVTQFMQDTLQRARASSSVRTLLGRRRLVPDIHSGNRATRLAVERVVMNTPIQGTAADLLKLAMLNFREPVTPGARMLLSVHDELVFEVPDAEVEAATPRIRERMEGVYALDVPLVVDVGVGSNWREAH